MWSQCAYMHLAHGVDPGEWLLQLYLFVYMHISSTNLSYTRLVVLSICNFVFLHPCTVTHLWHMEEASSSRTRKRRRGKGAVSVPGIPAYYSIPAYFVRITN